jgi:succinyl-diaminopimelate desuccinylase
VASLSFDAALEFARDLIRIPSPPGGEGAVAARVCAELEKLGFDEVRVDAVGNVLGTVRGTGSAPPVMLSCHLDIVDAGDVASWEHAPFAADVADGYLHGRGAMDIKGPLALQTYVAAQFLTERPPGDVLVGHTVFEERGGWGMAHMLAESGVKPGAVIIGEATNGDINIGHRGRAELLVEVRGAAAHASAPERAKNPLDLLPAVLHALQAFSATLGTDAVLGRATAVATAVQTFPESRNVIPERAVITVDWRVLPDTNAVSAQRDLSEFLRAHVTVPAGYSVNVSFARTAFTAYTGVASEREMFTPGFLMSPDHRVVRAAVRAVGAATYATPAVKPWTFATDGGHACGVHGIPCIGYAPGEERYAHTNRERLNLEDARRAYAAYPGLVRAVVDAIR